MKAPSTLAALDRATAFVAATGVEPAGVSILNGSFVARYDCDTEAAADELIAKLAPHIADRFISRHEYDDGAWTLIADVWSRLTHDSACVSVRRPVEAVAR